MKKIAIISLLLLVCPLIRAIEYTVDKVPNVHLDDGRRFVSNPDGILSAETVSTLDQMLFSLQEANTSEVAVVALQSIGDNDIDDFATELFTRWGIGKQNDNGLLVLLVLDQRRMTFRTGYGIEGILPDAICKRIQTQYVIPQFKSTGRESSVYTSRFPSSYLTFCYLLCFGTSLIMQKKTPTSDTNGWPDFARIS